MASALKTRKSRWRLVLALLLLALGTSVVIGASMGPAGLPVSEAFLILLNRIPVIGELIAGGSWPRSHEIIVVNVRFPRLLLGVLVGWSLAAAGSTYQAIFKNPMADPYILGVSAGAAAGATVAIVFGPKTGLLGHSVVSFFAFLGAVGTVFLVYEISRVGNRVPVTTLLLAGVAVSAFLTAVVSLMMVLSTDNVNEIVFWLLGSLSGRNWTHVLVILPYFIAGWAFILSHARDLNVMLLGEESAQQLGIDVEKTKKLLLLASSLMAAAAVSVTGIIGFVGLIVPHAMRLIVGPDHRVLLPASGLVGGIFLVIADTIARTLIPPIEIPVGVITALFGAPFFAYLLRKRKAGPA